MRTRHTGTWGEGSQAEHGDGSSPGGLRGSQGPVWLEQSRGRGRKRDGGEAGKPTVSMSSALGIRWEAKPGLELRGASPDLLLIALAAV